jgi:hypothetical protein
MSFAGRVESSRPALAGFEAKPGLEDSTRPANQESRKKLKNGAQATEIGSFAK